MKTDQKYYKTTKESKHIQVSIQTYGQRSQRKFKTIAYSK